MTKLGVATASGRCDLGSVLPFDANLRIRGNDWPLFGVTMVGHLRMENVKQAIESVVAKKLMGTLLSLGFGEVVFAFMPEPFWICYNSTAGRFLSLMPLKASPDTVAPAVSWLSQRRL